MSKLHNVRTVVDGIAFDSKKEAARYQELRLLEKAGAIKNLRRQVEYTLIPAQRAPDRIGPKGGRKPGRVLERACTYRADFVYEENGQTVVEDVKGMRTEVYRIKRKLMLYTHGIRIREA